METRKANKLSRTSSLRELKLVSASVTPDERCGLKGSAAAGCGTFSLSKPAESQTLKEF
jgi:hypothetical protein